MDKVISFFKLIGTGISNTFYFCTDKDFRDDVIFDYWTCSWKAKAVVFVLIPMLIIGGITTKLRGPQLWDCVMEQIDVGRETNFSLITGSCVIDSGKKDENGEVIWVKVKNDIAVGDFDGTQ